MKMNLSSRWNRARQPVLLAPCAVLLAVLAARAAEAPPQAPAGAELSSADWLKAQPKPAFRADYTLPRLTRYGWVLPFETKVELTESWGYALEFGGYVDDETVKRLDDPKSEESRMVALAKQDPRRYPVAVICSRKLPGTEAPPETWTRNKDGKVLNAKAKSMDGTQWSEGAGAVFSPEAPLSVWQLAGKYRADPLTELQKRGLPLSIVLNGGEYGVGVLGFGRPVWSQDPKICAAVAAEPFKGNWQDYVSDRKAKSEKAIADVVRAAVPKRDVYVYYTAGGGTLRNKDWQINDWGAQWKHMRGVSDLPSNEIYYKHFNDGFTGRLNLLSLALNAVSNEIATGDKLSYNWICAGWPRGKPAEFFADLARWTGFLKCYYTAGMLGANVGYYDFPPGGFGAKFPVERPPEWLKQMVASAHVHALFSQYEDLIRQGDLLPGPMKHAISVSDPAYEFPTGDETARVLVRKQRGLPTWLITAWASAGADRPVTVKVPELGRMELQARVCGSVYRASLAEGQVTLVQLDPDGATYTEVKTGTPVLKPVDLSVVKPTTKGLLLWLAADTGVTKSVDGKVSAWEGAGSTALKLTQADATHQPQWVATGINGKPALHCEEGRQWLALSLSDEQGKAFVGSLTIFTVFTGVRPNGDNRVLSAIADQGSDWVSGKGFKVTDGADPAALKQGIQTRVTNGELRTPLKLLAVGSMHGGGYTGFTGDLAEMLVYQGNLPPTTAALVLDYLNDRYTQKAP
jgi:hypothetical protein